MTTVLVADDDADHRELLTLALRRLGHRVVPTADAEGARRALGAGGIDAALLDVRMPGESGIDLCRRLRADPLTAELPIMLVSADVNGRRVLAGMEAGADDYLMKPYPRSELCARVEALLLRRSRSATVPATVANAAMLAARAALPATVPVAPIQVERKLPRTA